MKEKFNIQELYKAEKLKYTTIKKYEDVTPFAGKVVGYKCIKPSYYFTNGEGRFQVMDNKDLTFGLVSNIITNWNVSKGNGYGYSLDKLIKKGAGPGNTAFVNQQINEYAGGEIEMRLATKEELTYIADAIKTNLAEFCYDFKDYGLKCVLGQIESMADEI